MCSFHENQSPELCFMPLLTPLIIFPWIKCYLLSLSWYLLIICFLMLIHFFTCTLLHRFTSDYPNFYEVLIHIFFMLKVIYHHAYYCVYNQEPWLYRWKLETPNLYSNKTLLLLSKAECVSVIWKCITVCPLFILCFFSILVLVLRNYTNACCLATWVQFSVWIIQSWGLVQENFFCCPLSCHLFMKFVSDGVLLNAVPLLLMLHMVPGAAMIQCIIFVMRPHSSIINLFCLRILPLGCLWLVP